MCPNKSDRFKAVNRPVIWDTHPEMAYIIVADAGKSFQLAVKGAFNLEISLNKNKLASPSENAFAKAETNHESKEYIVGMANEASPVLLYM